MPDGIRAPYLMLLSGIQKKSLGTGGRFRLVYVSVNDGGSVVHCAGIEAD